MEAGHMSLVCWLVLIDERLGSYMLGKLFCVLALLILTVARQLRRYPLKWQNSPSSLFSCLFFSLLYTGTFNGLALTRKTKSAFILRLSHGRCAGPLLGLAVVAFSLSPPPVSLLILGNSNSVIFRILPPYLQINTCKRKIHFLLMKNAKKSRA